jgi:cell division protein FtsI (penicillin-binding protein 3)
MAQLKKKKRGTRAKREKPVVTPRYQARRWFLLGLLAVSAIALGWRAVDQQIFETDFLQNEGQRRHLRVVEVPAHRGMITDRKGMPLAISTPVDSVWANPRLLSPDQRVLGPLAKVLGLKVDSMRQLLARNSNRSFVYLKRRVNPDLVEQLNKLLKRNSISGIGLQREFRRFYPGGEVFAHAVGFTNVDDQGQEGLELAYDQWLRGSPGRKRVIRDGHARVVKDVESILPPRPGKDLVLSIDRRLQFLAYRELKTAVARNKAKAGTAVILDVGTGEVLAMVNQPSYNPNGAKRGRRGHFRNRAVTDVFEPGSTMKPFTVAAALESGHYRPETLIDTNPGYIKVGRNRVRDHDNLGVIDLTTVIRKSSNVGASKIALALPRESLWSLYSRVGFGDSTDTGFPGEANGQLTPFERWARIDQATLSFGYGLSVTALQLARAYSVLAADGVRHPLSLLRLDQPPEGEQVVSAGSTRALRRMMETVVSTEGTAPLAMVPGYRVAGKTGTVKKSVAGGYSKDKYLALFAGMVPVSAPRLVMVVMIDEPAAGKYYGGQVAAPVFSRVMAGAMRLLNIAPDALESPGQQLAAVEGVER